MDKLKITASDFYDYYKPAKCDLRVYLRHHAEEEEAPSIYQDLIRKLGQRHEKNHLDGFPSFIDLSSKLLLERTELTKAYVLNKEQVIYQGALTATFDSAGISYFVVGEPDFLICDLGSYIIRDSKLSRTINEERHQEIFRQLQLYGWLFQQTFDDIPCRLEVHSGTGAIVSINLEPPDRMLEHISEIAKMKLAKTEPYSPVGWSKCSGCSFNKRCWSYAEINQDVALIAGVDQALAIALHGAGFNTIESFVSNFDESKLADFKKSQGARAQRVGKQAKSILNMAQSMLAKKEILLELPILPDHPNYVMFDLEGLPPHLDNIEKIYLWGLQVFGQRQGKYIAAMGDFGADDDRQCWQNFLLSAQQIFQEHGDLPFVHWHQYERNYIDKYVKRYGDRDGIAGRVKQNLLDLLPIAKRCVALPTPSYSLKVIEKHIGFKRSQYEYGGDWSIAKYIEAMETEDEELRSQSMEQIKTYNKEDLEATWTVFQWLKQKAA